MRHWIVTLAGLIVFGSSLALAGGESGGGEPGALEFIAIGRKIINWVDVHPTDAFTKQEAEYVLFQLEEHLNSDRAKQYLIFTEGEVSCDLGSGMVPKMACSDKNGVVINRRSWDSSSQKQKLTVVLLELLKLMGKERRYVTAQTIARDSTQILALSEKPSANRSSDVRNGDALARRSLTFTIGKDIFVEPGKDLLYFFNGSITQESAAHGDLTANPPEKKFGPKAEIPFGWQKRYRSCILWLEHSRGGVLRKGRTFRSILGLDEMDGRVLQGTIEGLGTLMCENVQSEASFRRYEALKVDWGTSTTTMNLSNITPYFGAYFRITIDAVKPTPTAKDF